MRAILEIKDVEDSERARLIDYVRAHPAIWLAGQQKNKAKVDEAWQFIAAALSTAERVFEVALVKKIWKNLRDWYSKLAKGGNLETTKWQYTSAMAFLGTDFPTRAKKVKAEDGTDQPPKKKGKKAAAVAAEVQTPQQPTMNMQPMCPPMPDFSSLPPEIQQFYQVHGFPQQFMPKQEAQPMPMFPQQPAVKLELADTQTASWVQEDSNGDEGFATPERMSVKNVEVNNNCLETSMDTPETPVVQNPSPAASESCVRTSVDESGNAASSVFEPIRAELATFIMRLMELEKTFQR